jgi:hypothetical protein
MNKGFTMVIGMTIAYAVSFLGLILAWIYYRKHKKKETNK